MNTSLWNKIEQYDFDNPPREYGFSTRLANENYWTRNFTEQAIVEYKKFIYLAAVSDLMVSPSEIVDIVWHEHLIFTQSYQDFCILIGKQVQHVPSTRTKEEAQRFIQAKERTVKLYEENFGKQPAAIWNYRDMYASLNLDKAKMKLRMFVIIGILAIAALAVPFYYLLRPVYVQIDNPYFLIGYLSFAILCLLGLAFYNSTKLRDILDLFDRDSFIYNLQPYELVYMETGKLQFVIHGVVNELVEAKVITVNPDKTLELAEKGIARSVEQLQVTSVLSEMGATTYPVLLRQMLVKPVFVNIKSCMEAFKKYFNKSKKFGNIFYVNFSVLSFILILGFVRLATGILREKPVGLLTACMAVLTIISIIYLIRLVKRSGPNTVLNLYKMEILTTPESKENWQWSYFLSGTAVLSTSFFPLVNQMDRRDDSMTSSLSSCGSSCGSSCSSCGGCGGGD